MSCYFVAQIDITDRSLYQQYLDGFDQVFRQYAGTVVAVDDAPEVLEGVWDRTRIVLIRFPDEAALKRWYGSEAYQALARYRQQASRADVLLVHGR